MGQGGPASSPSAITANLNSETKPHAWDPLSSPGSQNHSFPSSFSLLLSHHLSYLHPTRLLMGKVSRPSGHRSLTQLRPSCNWVQVRLPTTPEANAREAGANVNERGLLSGTSHQEDGGLASQSPSPPLSAGRGFIRRERGQNKEIRGGGCKVLYTQNSTVQSNKAGDGPGCVILTSHLASRHPKLTVEGQQLSWTWDVF